MGKSIHSVGHRGSSSARTLAGIQQAIRTLPTIGAVVVSASRIRIGLRERTRTAAFVSVVLLGANVAHASLSAAPNPNTTGDYTVSWAPAAGAQWYELYESTNGGVSWSAQYRTASGTTSKAFTDKPVGTYTYALKKCYEYYDQYMELITVCNNMYSPITVTVNPPPPPPIPSGLSAPSTDYNGSYQISWNSASGAASYRLQEKKGSGSWTQIYSGSETSRSVSGRTQGTYYYRVRACNSHPTCSNWSSWVSVTIPAPPAVPAGLTAPTTDHNGSYSVSWNAASGASRYRLQEKEGSTAWVQIYSGSSTSKGVIGNAAGSWSYRVRSCNPEVCSTWSAIRTVTVADPPAVPTGLAGPSVDNDGAYTISWNPSTGSLSYQLWELPSGGSWQQIYWDEPTAHTLSGHEPNTYTYKARGCNVEQLCGAWSATFTVVVPEPPPPPEIWLPTDDSDFPDAVVVPLSPPSGDTGVGALAGSGGVSGGSASYEVPITVPPGRRGMQPRVSLSYTSRSGNGIAGVGWRLSAGSAISRCPATAAQDQFTAGVQYDAVRDRLCLDGRRLVVVSGVYGQSGAEYRTELDIFARITQFGGLNGSTTSFTVEYKDGRTSKYGTTAGSRHSAAGRTEILTWAIRETQDQSDNTITYDYQTFGDGEHLLSAIHYTGVAGSDGDRHVRFEYEPRGDYRTSYLATGRSRSTQRLKSVRTEYQTTPVRKYTLSYGAASASTGRSLLRSIEECAYLNGIQAHCLPLTNFEWQEQAPQYVAERLQFSNNGVPVTVHADERWLHEVLPHGDANGDGVKDWTTLYVNAEGEITGQHNELLASCIHSGNFFSIRCLEADFDSDGLTDAFRNNSGVLEVRYAGQSTWVTTGLSWTTDGLHSENKDNPIGFADFNGDGRVDLAFKQNSKLWIYFHTGNYVPYSATNRQWLLDYPGEVHHTSAQIAGDMDGNGTPDIVVFDNPSMYLSGHNPSLPIPDYIILTYSQFGGTMGTSIRDIADLPSSQSIDAYFFHDVNADGLPDLMRVPVGFNLNYRLNDGTDFIGGWTQLNIPVPVRQGEYQIVPGEPEPYYMPIMSKILTMDYDGDGRQEFLIAGPVLASGCASIMEYVGGTPTTNWYCDDELYGNYNPEPFAPVGAPMHGDVKDDSVRRYIGYRLNEDINGVVTATSFTTDIIASAAQTAVIDATGDGLPDVVTVFGCRLSSQYCKFNADTTTLGGTVNSAYVAGAWINRNLGASSGTCSEQHCFEGYDLMSAVEDGLGVRHEWTYRPLSSDKYATPNSDFYEVDRDYVEPDPDYFHFASSMYVVADYRTSNGAGGLNSTKYRYRGAIFNNEGRGFQGFRSIIVEQDVFGSSDPQANTDKITRTDFFQKWPLSSIVEQSCTWIAADNVADDNPNCSNVLSHTTIDAGTIHNVITRGTARFVAVKTQTEEVFGLNTGFSIGTDVLNRDFDIWGNVTSEIRTHTDDYGTVVTRTTQAFSANEAIWWLDKLTSRTVTHDPVTGRVGPVIAPGADQVKTVTTDVTEYDDAHRLPKTVTITANDTPLTQTVTTLYNSRGLPTSVTTIGTGITGPRAVESTYTDNGTTASENGYFPFTVENALGHQTKYETAPAHGQPTKIVDPNGLVSTTSYDAFGRPSAVTPAGKPTQHVRYFWCDSSCPADATHWIGSYSAGAPETRSYVDQIGRARESWVRNFADSGFIRVRTEYDERGHKTYESQPYDPGAGELGLLGTRYLSYDALGRLQSKEVDQANGTILLTSYIYEGLKTRIFAGGLPEMHRIYNGLGQLVETKDAMTGVTRYAYDGAGNPIVLDDPLGGGVPGADSIVAKYNALGHKVWIDDPNLGQKVFTYNALGEVLSDEDINCPATIGCDTIEMDYDVLGRLVERRANGVVAGRWFYDDPAPDKGLGLLDYEESRLTGPHGLRKEYFYALTGSGRKDLKRVLHRFYENGAPHDDYEIRYYTDSYYGRPKGLRYEGGVGVAYVYNANGYLTQEEDASSSYVLRQVTARDSRNQVLQATLANGTLNHTAEYYSATGQMKSITVTGTTGGLHALDYEYDGFGNLDYRTKEYGGATSTETLVYDDLHRLTESTRVFPGGSKTVTYGYDASGDLTFKSDYATSYTYLDPRPNAVSSITKIDGSTVTPEYDANGNMLEGDGKTLTYSAFNQPLTITAGGVTASFAYGADLARYRQDKGTGETTLYIDKLMEVVRVGTAVDYRHYLGDVAILTKTGSLNDPDPSVRFVHRDRLGGVVTITDELGYDEGRGYGPFGKPREADWAEKDPPVVGSAITDRGFTDHEHLDDSQLIHMNGRVYDYNLGRFLSVDPIIQEPGNSQSLNPYSYIMNNPLAGTDPSGYFCRGTRIGSDDGSICGGGGVNLEISVTGKKANINITGGTQAQREAVANGIDGALKHLGFRPVSAISENAIDEIGSLQELASDTSAAGVDSDPAPPLGGPGVVPATFCEQAGLSSGCYTADVTPYGYPFSLYGDDPDLLYETVEEYAEVYEHRFDLVIGLSPLGWFTPFESDDGVAHAGSRGGALARAARQVSLRAIRMGRRGEALVRDAHDIGPRTMVRFGGQNLIPDGLHSTRRVLSEVKNVRYLSYTRQLRAYVAYAQANRLRFDLYVRPGEGTRLSAPLREAIEAGLITLKAIP